MSIDSTQTDNYVSINDRLKMDSIVEGARPDSLAYGSYNAIMG